MHESGMIEDLIAKVESLAREKAAHRVVAVEVSVGPLAGISGDHLREHFLIAAQGTLADGAELRVREPADPAARDPLGVFLESVELEA
ncbi:MAG: hydrogenase maturation nickel metallochaperone HypA [Acidobacteria bacterium]|nr:hydrogenase maturation nickel metallochaperone HypA [Acidobacteriota bacterium]